MTKTGHVPPVDGTHICFVFRGYSDSGKTQCWDVNTKDDSLWLGAIQWYGRWRCYSFRPAPQTEFEKTCLREIADFCERLTKEHRAKRPRK